LPTNKKAHDFIGAHEVMRRRFKILQIHLLVLGLRNEYGNKKFSTFTVSSHVRARNAPLEDKVTNAVMLLLKLLK